MKKSLAITVAIIATGAGVASAGDLSADGRSVRSTTVAFSRADSQSSDGALALYERLRAAASEVCADAGSIHSVGGGDYKHCKSTALTQAVQEVNIPAVSAIHTRSGTVEVMASR